MWCRASWENFSNHEHRTENLMAYFSFFGISDPDSEAF